MKEIELISKRKLREKHFLREDGTIRAEIYDDDIHYLDNGKYKEIDNTLVEKNGYYSNKNNGFKVHFCKNSKSDLVTVENKKHFLNIYLSENNGVNLYNKNNESKITKDISSKEIINVIDIDHTFFS